MKTVLVTGGAGFIGGNLVHALVADGRYRVVTVDLLTYAGNVDTLAPVIDSDRHVFVAGDICDRELADRLFADHRPAAIMNLAAESHVDRSIDGPADFLRTNVGGTFTLLEAARSYWGALDGADRESFRFMHISTDEVYGSLGDTGAFTEKTPYAPNSPYAASKAAADHFVRAYHHTYGLPTLTTNCSNNYGPYQFPEKLIPLMIEKGLTGQPLPVYGDGLNVRDWLYVGDHVAALMAVLEKGRPGETYNIGGRAEMTNIDVVKTLCAILDEERPDAAPHEKLVAYVTDRPGHDRRYAIDPTKIETELGFVPAESFTTGIRKTVRWYLTHREWIDRIASGAYRGERLGLKEKDA
jgi:dTDP-glucose 4,6-dehydratase